MEDTLYPEIHFIAELHVKDVRGLSKTSAFIAVLEMEQLYNNSGKHRIHLNVISRKEVKQNGKGNKG